MAARSHALAARAFLTALTVGRDGGAERARERDRHISMTRRLISLCVCNHDDLDNLCFSVRVCDLYDKFYRVCVRVWTP